MNAVTELRHSVDPCARTALSDISALRTFRDLESNLEALRVDITTRTSSTGILLAHTVVIAGRLVAQPGVGCIGSDSEAVIGRYLRRAANRIECEDLVVSRQTILTTDRLELTTWLPSDLDDLATLHSDPETMQHIGYGRAESLAESHSRIDGYIEEQRRQGWTKWRVANRDGDMVGRAGFGEVDSCRDLAYAFRRDQCGRGFATEIASALVDWNFQYPARDLLSSSLCAYVEAGHRASIRVLEKVGFDFVDMREYKSVNCAFFQYPGQ